MREKNGERKIQVTTGKEIADAIITLRFEVLALPTRHRQKIVQVLEELEKAEWTKSK